MKLIPLFCLLFVCASCIQNKPPAKATNDTVSAEPVVKDSVVYYPIKDNRIKVDLNHPQQASLFDYFSHVELIPLETSDRIVIGQLEKVLDYQDRYYTLDYKQAQVSVFDKTGKFLYNIGRSGQGPEEYLPLLSDIFINPFTGNIDLLSPFGFVYSYDLSGKHVKTSKRITNEELHNVNQVIAISEKMYVFIVFADNFHLAFYDIEQQKILFQTYENFALNHRAKFYKYNNRWYFVPVFDNKIYEITTDSLIESYMLDFGKFNYKLTEQIFPRGLPIDRIAEANKYPYRMYLQGQNNRYVIAELYLKNSVPAILMYDKSINESKLIERFTESVDFEPYIVTNEYVLSWCYHGALEKRIPEEMLDETNRQIFKKLINTVGEELNPVIIKYYFK